MKLREALRAATLRAEPDAVDELVDALADAERRLDAAKARATRWVEVARADKRARPLVDSVLEQFPLDSAPGKALMSLAEALLRTPDQKRADQLIAERLAAIRSAGVTGSDDLLLRTGFALLGTRESPVAGCGQRVVWTLFLCLDDEAARRSGGALGPARRHADVG